MPKLLILPCKIKEHSHDPGYDVIVYANVYESGKVVITRVSRWGTDIIFDLTKEQRAELQTEMETAAKKKITQET